MTDKAIDNIRRSGNAAIRSYLAGEEALKPSEIASEENPGWFNADDVIWKVNSDPALLIGGLASLLIQVLHPRVMAGVADHSDYETDPLGRFRRTGRFIGATTFGTKEVADTAVAIVNKIHEKINGQTQSGEEYSAVDSELLGWVHVTEVYCFWKSYEDYGPGDDTPEMRDTYVEQMMRTAKALGHTDPPRNWDEVEQRLEHYKTDCIYDDVAAKTIGFLLNPEVVAVPMKPAYLLVAGGALRLLPRWSREMLMLPLPPVSTPLAIKPAAKAIAEVLRWFSVDPSVRFVADSETD